MGIYDTKTGITLEDAQVPFVAGSLPPSLERRYMNPIRFRMNYRIVPGFAALCMGCVTLSIILMERDDRAFLWAFLVLMGILAAACIWVVMQVPKMRKLELQAEMDRYDLEPAAAQPDGYYALNYEGRGLILNGDGIRYDGQFSWYNHLNPRLVTSNRFMRVWIAIQFGTDPMKSLFVPLCPTLLAAIRDFQIPLENPEALEFLLTHKENAFAQILVRGTFRIFKD